MVYYYTSAEGHLIYVGKDKFENEELIKYGWEEDVWFHVNDVSSPHVYLRLKDGETWDSISPAVLEQCSQLVKDDSIQGSKMSTVKVVYTPWNNLHKTLDMEVGAIGFRSEKNKKYLNHIKKDKDILKALKKTFREETNPDFKALKQQRINTLKQAQKKEYEKQQQIQREIEKEQKKEAELRNYDLMMDPNLMRTNKQVAEDEEDDDDFM